MREILFIAMTISVSYLMGFLAGAAFIKTRYRKHIPKKNK